jgi:hypothetical protein
MKLLVMMNNYLKKLNVELVNKYLVVKDFQLLLNHNLLKYLLIERFHESVDQQNQEMIKNATTKFFYFIYIKKNNFTISESIVK